jgi:hypothetical protein
MENKKLNGRSLTTFLMDSLGSDKGNFWELSKEKELEPNFRKMFRVEKIYVNLEKKTLTVWWGEDNTRTTVTCSDRDEFTVEDGFRAALAKKIYGKYENYERFFGNKVVFSGKRTKIEFETLE